MTTTSASARVEHLAGEVGGRRRLDDLDPVRRRDGEVRRDERHVGAAAPRLARERDSHLPGGAVADEADRVERLARPPGADEHALPAQRPGGAEELEAAGEDRLGLGHAARRRARPRRARPPPARSARRRARRAARRFACVAGCSHMRTFIAGATSNGPRTASAAWVRTLSARPCASLASVFAESGATTSRSASARCG